MVLGFFLKSNELLFVHNFYEKEDKLKEAKSHTE